MQLLSNQQPSLSLPSMFMQLNYQQLLYNLGSSFNFSIKAMILLLLLLYPEKLFFFHEPGLSGSRQSIPKGQGTNFNLSLFLRQNGAVAVCLHRKQEILGSSAVQEKDPFKLQYMVIYLGVVFNNIFHYYCVVVLSILILHYNMYYFAL